HPKECEVTASQHMVQANGLRFRAMADGPASGEMVILLHGFPEGAESWSKQIDSIARGGALAVAPDMRGYGLSDAPSEVDDYRIDHLVEDVAGIVRAFGRPSAHVAGHDWCAMVAWFFANLPRDNWWAGLRRDVKVNAPTTLLWGDQDPALGRLQAEKTGEYMTGDYRLEVLEGAGHWLQFERPDEVGLSLRKAISK